MKILDILNAPWAIVPAKLAEITEIYSHHIRREKIDVKAIEASLGRPLSNERKPYEVVNGVAVLNVDGVLAPRMNLFMEISGGTSTQILARELADALGDAQIAGVVLLVDSPGGTVHGTQELARMVMEGRERKPIVAFATGMIASAAYYIGSAADQVLISSDATVSGSIGVAMQHVDYSKREEMMGVKTTDIYAGKYKRIASQTAPLSEEGRDYLQSQVDHLYAVFVEDVAKQRGVPVDTVLQNMADGRVFIGRQGIDAGLVDGVSTLDAVISELAAGTYRRKRMAGAGAAPVASVDANSAGAALTPEPPPTKGTTMDMQTLLRDHPQLAEALRAEGATAELARIQAVQAQALPGHEKLVATLMFDGKTTGPEAAVQILAAERQKTAGRLSQIENDAPPAVPHAPTASGERHPEEQVDQNLPIEQRCKATWDKDPAVRAAYADDFSAYLAYEKASAGGKVRILGGKRSAA